MGGEPARFPERVRKLFGSPKTVLSRFITKNTLRSGVLWAITFGIYIASKAIGSASLYPSEVARHKFSESLTNNPGIEFLLGRAPHSSTIAAFTAWNTLNIVVTIGAIWSILLSTKYFRGEEDSGRMELFLVGQTTQRTAIINTFAGLGASLGVFYVVLTTIVALTGNLHGVDFNLRSAAFFALAVTSGVALFITIGALASQLMASRSRAASVAASIMGVSFLGRAIGDITGDHLVLDINPLGWIENLQPLSNSQPLWLIPIFSLTLALAAIAIYLGAKRDIQSSIFADKTVSKPHFKLLNSPLGAALRTTRTSIVGWLVAITIAAFLYGLMAKSTIQEIDQSKSTEKVLLRLAHQSQTTDARAFLGAVLLLQMVLIMTYAASSISAVRRDEADGELDNFLVRPISRVRWLLGRLLIIATTIVLAGFLTTIGIWLGVAHQHIDVPFITLLTASINAIVPGIFTLSMGIFSLGIRPRFTSIVVFGTLGWSFLVEMIGSGIKLDHWILDTSIFHHLSLAPATAPKWSVDLIVVILFVVLTVIGTFTFVHRDLMSE